MAPKQKRPRPEAPKQPPRSLDDADRIAITKSMAKKPHQSRYEDVFIINMTCDPSPGDLGRLYIQIHNHILKVASAQVEHDVIFEKPRGGYPRGFDRVIDPGVPVTTPPSMNCDYFIIQLNGRAGEPDLQFAIRLDNLYCVGFRAIYPNDDVKMKKWYSFGEIHLLRCAAFPNVEKSKYPEGYYNLVGLQFYPDLIRNVYTHFAFFENDPKTTDEGVVFKDSFFVVVMEGTRYWFAQQLAYDGMKPGNPVPVTLTALMSDLIHDWKRISLAILLLWLAEEEDKLHLGPAARKAAKQELKKFDKYVGLIKLKGPDEEPKLDLLAARSLFALLHNSDIVRKILIRRLNFVKSIPDRLKAAAY